MLKPIHKFNNARGATLCHKCSKIISIGFTKELYCSKQCEAKHRAAIYMHLKGNKFLENFYKQMENEVHYNRSNLNKL